MVGVCKLCLQEKELIKKSRIISGFMYKNLMEDGAYIVSNLKDNLNGAKPKKRVYGEYDRYILCYKCDNEILGSLETYSSKFLYNESESGAEFFEFRGLIDSNGLKYTQCLNVDYKKFKLFLLSVLWRASISERDFFDLIELGDHQEKIRSMIYNDDPGKENEYPIEILTVANNPKIPLDFIIKPRKVDSDNDSLYIFPITGMFIIFHVGEGLDYSPIINNILKEDNTFLIGHIPDSESWNFTLKFLS